ncbi:MAG TPA: hypothetical protein VFN75_09425 [Pseudonocardiaceae bacterium]|nr:hypothetical protein [Pseudonocardiaceae bacterium]
MPRTLNVITFGARGKRSGLGSSSVVGDRLAPVRIETVMLRWRGAR